MKQEGIVAAGLFIGIGLFLGGMQIKSGIARVQDAQRVVSVKGLAEREVPADKVTWPIVYKEVGNDLLALYGEIERNNQKVLAFLRENGIEEGEITVSQPDIIDYQTERYVQQDGIRYRYNGTSVITVSSNRVDKVRGIIPTVSKLIKEGINISANRTYENPVVYSFTGLNEVKPAMIEEATKNARISAEKFATDSQSRLGKIKTANQGQISISNRDENSPHIKTLRVVTTINYYLKD